MNYNFKQLKITWLEKKTQKHAFQFQTIATMCLLFDFILLLVMNLWTHIINTTTRQNVANISAH